jgi:FG-GAP-like repeat
MTGDGYVRALVVCLLLACIGAASPRPAGAYAIIENSFSGSGTLRIDLDTSGSYYIRCESVSLSGTVAVPPGETARIGTWSAGACTATKEGITLGTASVTITRLPTVRATSATTVEFGRIFEVDVAHFSRTGAVCHYEVFPRDRIASYSSAGGFNRIIIPQAYSLATGWDINYGPNPPSCPEPSIGNFETGASFPSPQFAVSSVPDPGCDYLFASSIKMAEMNNDLKVDAFQFAGNTNGYEWLSNGMAYPTSIVIGTGFARASQVRTGDIDGDGDDDVFLFTDEGTAYIYRSNGTSYGTRTLLGSGFGRVCEMRLADMNGDRKDDILQFRSNGRAYAWLSNGTSYSYLGLIGTGFGSTYQDRTADIDGDGDADIFQILDTGVAHAWRSNGTSYTGLGPIATGVGNSEVVRFADKDGDGDDDLFRFTDDGEGYWWRSDRTAYTELGFIGSGFGLVRQVRVADMNADRRVDVFKFEDTGIGYAWQANLSGGYTSLGQIGTGFGAP